ncbi:MAG: M20/M25/M40 family metallo-hydrolase [Anaerolineales bacterium]|nr:M20/M25/M40 family metallo-hydrolase [Anaerolineales bacterium]
MSGKRWSSVISFFIFILFSTGCALIDPPSVVIPTPVPTVPSIQQTLISQQDIVTDPVSNVVPDVDPDIEALVNAVSQQQLMGYVQALESFGTRNAFSDPQQEAWGVGAARRWIFNEFGRVGQASNGRLQVRFDDFPLNVNGLTANQQNVVAVLPGTAGTEEVIVIMAHYDTRPPDPLDGVSRAPGANDNASGVALLLETARLLSSRQWNQTIIFVALAAEEQGTFGAKNMVQNLMLNNAQVLAAINYDTVGGNVGIPQHIRLFAPDLTNSSSGQLGRYYDYIAGLYVPTFPIDVINAMDREERWGDHREFIFAGMPAVRLTQSVEDPIYLNSTRDTWSAIDYSYLEQVTKLTVSVVGNMAGAPPRPQPPLIVPMAAPSTFLFTWDVDPQASGYAISLRPLASETYPPFRFVGAAEAGNVALTGIDTSQEYMVSLAPLNANGRLGLFSPEVPLPRP